MTGCERAFKYVHGGPKSFGYPYTGKRYDNFFRFMRLYKHGYLEL